MEDLSSDRYTVQPEVRYAQRDRKIARRKGRQHPVNGIAMKRLLNERAAKAQASK